MDDELMPWDIGERTYNLSEVGQALAKKARDQMQPVPLSIDVGPLVSEDGVTARRYDENNLWVRVEVYCERVPSDGSGDVNYYLAHELGHAIRIATNVEPPELQEMYVAIQENPALKPTSLDDAQDAKTAKARFMKEQPDHVKQMIVDDEIAAWAIARELFEGIEHDEEHLAELERVHVAGYQSGLFPDSDYSP